MNTCGTCQHFGAPIEDYLDSEYENYGPTGYHRCNLIDLKRKKQTAPQPLAYVQDGSDYVATLRVRSDFGCVEWAERAPLPQNGCS